eukprot:COSAG02_NODE_4049_length_5862_cov_2.302100_3_plen_476_part_00
MATVQQQDQQQYQPEQPPEQPPQQLQVQPPAEGTTIRVVAFCLVMLSTLAAFAVLVYLQDILIPFTFAFFLACVLEPMQRLVIHAVMVAVRTCTVCIASTNMSASAERGTAAEREPLTTAGGHVQQQPSASGPSTPGSRTRHNALNNVCGQLVLRMTGVVVCVLALVSCLTGFVAVSALELERLGALADAQNWNQRGEEVLNKTMKLVNRTHLPPSQIEAYVRSALAEAPSMVKEVLVELGDFSADLLLVCVIVFFLLWARAATHVHAAAVIDPADTPRTVEAHRLHLRRIEPSRLQGSIQTQIRTYFQLKTLTSALLGAAVGVSLLALGVPGSGFFGIITAVANFIPVFGGPIAALLPLPVVILDPDISLTRGFLALVLPIGIHTLLANVVEPVLFGAGHGAEGTKLDPTIMLISMSVWDHLWGLSGLVLAVPLTICLRLVFHDLDRRHARSTSVFGMLDRMLAGEFVLDGRSK